MTLTRRTSENSPGSPRPAQAPGARPGTTPRFIRRVTGLSGIAATAVAAVSGYLYFMFPGNPHRRWQPGRPGARAVRRDHRLRRLPRRAAAPDSPAHHRRATGPAHRTRRRRRRGRVPEEQRWPDPRAGAHQSEHPPAPRPERLPSSTTLTHAESQDEGCHRGPAGSTPRKCPRMPWPRPL